MLGRSTTSMACQAEVVAALRDPVLRRCSFTLRSSEHPDQTRSVAPEHFDEVALAISLGQIQVRTLLEARFPTGQDLAVYQPAQDTLAVPGDVAWHSSGPARHLRRGLVLHECVHAWADKNSVRVEARLEEAAAYIVQVFYMIAYGAQASQGPHQSLNRRRIWTTAFPAAQTVSRGEAVTQAQTDALMRGLMNSGLYNSNDCYEYHGLG